MASGRTHSLATVVASPIPGIVAVSVTGSTSLGVSAVLGCLSGVVLSPDLDQISISFVEWKVIRATAGLGYLWLALWGPYATLVPHRHPISHFPVVGTLLRLLYLYAVGTTLQSACFVWTLPSLRTLVETPSVQWAIIGLIVSDFLHWVFDVLSPKQRRSIKNKLLRKLRSIL